MSASHVLTRGPTPDAVMARALLALTLALLVSRSACSAPAEGALTAAAVLAGSDVAPSDASQRRFAAPALAYVTPWNARGFEHALTYAAKLTHVAPAWYALRPDGLDGREAAAERAAWSHSLRAAGPRLVPRVTLELDAAALTAALRDHAPTAALLVAECDAMAFDGVALDGWAGWAAAGVPRAAAVALFRAIAAALHASGRVLVLAAPPPVPAGRGRAPPGFDRLDFDAMLAPADARGAPVDFVSLMTYDASLAGAGPGPNAPLAWQAASLSALLARRDASDPLAQLRDGDVAEPDVAARGAHVLLGLNFYGYDFALGAARAPEAVRGDDVARLLREHPEALVAWDGDAKEHHIDYKTTTKTAEGKRKSRKHRIYYPTPASLQARRRLHVCHTAVGLTRVTCVSRARSTGWTWRAARAWAWRFGSLVKARTGSSTCCETPFTPQSAPSSPQSPPPAADVAAAGVPAWRLPRLRPAFPASSRWASAREAPPAPAHAAWAPAESAAASAAASGPRPERCAAPEAARARAPARAGSPGGACAPAAAAAAPRVSYAAATLAQALPAFRGAAAPPPASARAPPALRAAADKTPA